MQASSPIRPARFSLSRSKPAWDHLAERWKLVLVLLVALAQGLIYLFTVPPWQHYDEPSHFEYARLIVDRGGLPAVGETDPLLRRDIITSMIAHSFYWNMGQPNWLLDDPRALSLGYSQLNDPPAYYLLVSVPLRLVRYLPVTAQLYVARLVSLSLFLATIAIAAGMMRDLTSPRHPLRWAVPLSLVLMPPFADLMTAVNNDVGAVFVVALFLWGAVRTLRYGLTPLRVLWLAGAVVLAVLVKNTAALIVILAPLVLLLRLWLRFGWRWRWLFLGGVAILAAVPLALWTWDDAAYWYRLGGAGQQLRATRTPPVAAAGNAHAITLVRGPEARGGQLANALLDADVRSVAGQTVTVGGWIWADRPVTVTTPSLFFSVVGAVNFENASQSFDIGTTPEFVAWTFEVPRQTKYLFYSLASNTPSNDQAPLTLTLVRPFLVRGAFPTDVEPTFDDDRAVGGTWAGQRFTNLVRNPSATARWSHVRPWVDQVIGRFAPQPLVRVIPSLFDWELSWPFLFSTVGPWLLRGLWTGFAWGHIRLAGQPWSLLFSVFMLVALAGCLRWVVRRPRRPGLLPVLLFLGISTAVLWMNALIWPLPLIWARIPLPSARYMFPVMLPLVLALCGGWWAIWPGRSRPYGLYTFVGALFALNAVSLWTIWSFYQNVAASLASVP